MSDAPPQSWAFSWKAREVRGIRRDVALQTQGPGMHSMGVHRQEPGRWQGFREEKPAFLQASRDSRDGLLLNL